ncbi:MAG: GNAT family N-acetyltransferase [Acidobacteria bacterium]|nr:GNAT family N-acetyltransferase [Acidobacteriota bacterium]MCB9397481.1 GNAT family N-acetyltransferase [Acidobacteriota bacterium]
MIQEQCEITRFQAADFDGIVAIDARTSGREKRAFWRDFFSRNAANPNTMCLVAKADSEVIGYLVGEIRAYEFGQEPSGWVLSLGVVPEKGRRGCGRSLLEEFGKWVKENGIQKIRTMVTHEQTVLHRFFRSTGFGAGPYTQLEQELS